MSGRRQSDPVNKSDTFERRQSDPVNKSDTFESDPVNNKSDNFESNNVQAHVDRTPQHSETRQPNDSSAQTALDGNPTPRSTTLKYTIAARTIQIDLDVELAPTRPTDLYTDAQAELDGKGGERMPKSSRWMGTRYAMVRHAESSETIRLRKARAEDNVAGIVTKCLAGEAFKINRAKILGLPYYTTVDTVATSEANRRKTQVECRAKYDKEDTAIPKTPQLNKLALWMQDTPAE
jgi:hypothetical protein